MKNFCASLREHAITIINFKKKEMEILAKEQLESFENAKLCYICKKIKDKYVKDKKHCRVRDHFHYIGEYGDDVHSMWNLKYSLSKQFL